MGEDQEDGTDGAVESALLHSSPGTRRPSRPSSAPGCTGLNPWSGSRATKSSSAGGRSTTSPASTPSRATRRSKSASRRISRWAGGSTSSKRPCGQVNWMTGATPCWTPRRPTWSGNRAKKPGRTSSPRCAPTGGPPDTSHPARTPCGAKARRWYRSGSTWPTCGGRAASGRTRSGRRSAQQLTAIDPDWNGPWPLDGSTREGQRPVPRSHSEQPTVHGKAEPVAGRMGIENQIETGQAHPGTVVALAQEAGVPRNALTQRPLDLKNDFYRQVRARGQTPDSEMLLVGRSSESRNSRQGRPRTPSSSPSCGPMSSSWCTS